MRTTFLVLVLLLLALGSYAYIHNPAGCAKVGDDLMALAESLSPVRIELAGSASSSSALNSGKAWTPPAVIPAQPNWTWTTSDGKTFTNVTIAKIEADRVTILHSDGGATIPIATLPPEIQKQLNYDPDAAAQAASSHQSESK